MDDKYRPCEMDHPRHSASHSLIHLVLNVSKPKLFGLLLRVSTNFRYWVGTNIKRKTKTMTRTNCWPELVHHVVGPSLTIGRLKRDELLLAHIHLKIEGYSFDCYHHNHHYFPHNLHHDHHCYFHH